MRNLRTFFLRHLLYFRVDYQQLYDKMPSRPPQHQRQAMCWTENVAGVYIMQKTRVGGFAVQEEKNQK